MALLGLATEVCGDAPSHPILPGRPARETSPSCSEEATADGARHELYKSPADPHADFIVCAGQQQSWQVLARAGLEVWAPSGGAGVSAAPPEAPPSMPRVDSNLPLQWGAMCQRDAELEKLRAALEDEAIVAFRQVLSHHTTTACQPRKAPGSVSSLKETAWNGKHGRAGEWHAIAPRQHLRAGRQLLGVVTRRLEATI